jgi:hypothetical protein
MVDDITEAVWRRLLDSFYPVPVWEQHWKHGVSSRGDDLAAGTVRDLLELRWRVLWRHRLDPGARIGYRLDWIDLWIQDALREEAANDAAARSGLSWGPRS